MGKLMSKLVFKNKAEKLSAIPENFFEVNAVDIKGNPVNFASLKGKYKGFLVTNVACSCGLTSSNYTQLVEFQDKYRDQGLLIMGFPCNQFMNQESKSENEIEEYVKKHFNANLMLFKKIEVNGDNAHPLYKFLRRNSSLYDPATGNAKQIPWNFAKFLVNREGKVVGYHGPKTEPKEFENEIADLVKN